MPRFRNFQTNFSGGLLSEGMLGRVDLAQYENGCKQLTNWWPKVTGGMQRRPGSLFLAQIDNAIRIESFIFSEDQTYLVVLSSTASTGIKVFSLAGVELENLSMTGVASSWNETVIKELSISQKGDVMFLAHENFPPQIIRRTGATSFELDFFQFEASTTATQYITGYPKFCPFFKFADVEVKISVNGYQENTPVTITSDPPAFTDEHVGQAIRYRGKQIYITSVPGPIQPQTTCSGLVIEELDRGATLSFPPLSTAAQDFEIGEIIVGRDSGIKAEVVKKFYSSINVAMISGVWSSDASEQVEGLTSGNIAPIILKIDIDPPATADWDEEAFTPDRGYPSAIEFHSQRLWLGGSSSLPAHIFGSRVAAFFNFDAGDALPAESIQVAISGNQINKVTNIVSGRHLQIFTDAGEFYAPQTEDRPLIPETFNLIKETRYGAKRDSARVFDESTIFLQAQGSAIREFIWQDRYRGYNSEAISLIAEEHINAVAEIEVLYGGYDRPEQIAFFVNGDGTVTWYHAARAEQIRTWGKWTTQGSYKSLTVLQDTLYALVERTSNDGTELFLEQFEPDVTLDCAAQSSDTAKSIWLNAVADRWESVSMQATSGVAAYDPDYYLGEYVIAAGGDIDISPLSVDNITVGLGFTQTLETMPIEVKDQGGVTGGMPKRLVSADIYMRSTLACSLDGNEILTFLGENDLSAKPEPITGVRKFYLLGYDERPTLVVQNAIPVPCEVLSLGAEVEY